MTRERIEAALKERFLAAGGDDATWQTEKRSVLKAFWRAAALGEVSADLSAALAEPDGPASPEPTRSRAGITVADEARERLRSRRRL